MLFLSSLQVYGHGGNTFKILICIASCPLFSLDKGQSVRQGQPGVASTLKHRRLQGGKANVLGCYFVPFQYYSLLLLFIPVLLPFCRPWYIHRQEA